MIKNLKTDINRRGVVFEELARMLLRYRRKNNFIFCTRSFDNMNDFSHKYKFDFSEISLTVMSFLNNNFSSVDLIEFIVSNKTSRIVQDMVFYEVKSKTQINNSRFDICTSSYKAYYFLSDKGFSNKLVSFVLFDDWKYSFNIHELDLSNYREYSRYKEK